MISMQKEFKKFIPSARISLETGRNYYKEVIWPDAVVVVVIVVMVEEEGLPLQATNNLIKLSGGLH